MFITAEQIHNGKEFLPSGSAIQVTETGIIEAITDVRGLEELQHFEGVLCPGFVNTHCHLELSHLKGNIPQGTGLIPFLQQIPFLRTGFTDEDKRRAREAAYEELKGNGVVAVGDICNTTDTLDLRERDILHVHSFVECIGFTAAVADRAFESMRMVCETLRSARTGLDKLSRASVVPHAPYSVSEALFRLIDQYEAGAIVSIHNQESEDENEYYRSKQGRVRDLLNTFGIDDTEFAASGKPSLQTYMEWLSPTHPLILVHNTASTEEDFQAAGGRFTNLYWCLCPNANLYIEGRLPDVHTLRRSGARICIGTDSLASNHHLSVFAELQTLHQHFPALEWETLLRWGSWNGARALQMEEVVGSIEPGKRPGVVQLRLEEQRVVPLF